MVGQSREGRTVLVSRSAGRARRGCYWLLVAVFVVMPIVCADAGGTPEPAPKTSSAAQESGSATLVSGDLTISCAPPTKGPQLYIEKVADKPDLPNPTKVVEHFEIFGNFLAYRLQNGNSKPTYVGAFENSELTLTINYSVQLRETLQGIPIQKVKFLFWDDKTKSWYPVDAGAKSDPSVSPFRFVFDPVKDGDTTLTIHVLGWPADDACVGCGG